MIVYFSGTGNSQYVAREIAALTNDQTYDAAACIRKKEVAALSGSQPFVFVAPVYVSAPPLAFLEFLRKCSYTGNRKAYFIMTCAGGMGGSPAYCKQLAEELGLEYMGTASVIMPQNYIAFFNTKTVEENKKILNAAKDPIAALAQDISLQKLFRDPNMKKWEYLSTEMILKPYYKWFINAKQFHVSQKCIGCGKCEKVCPLGNISMVEKVPHWRDHCTHCMACINLCPVDAIDYGKKTIGKIRYRGPDHVLK